MKRSVRISLKRETLTDLTGDDLGAIAGGASADTCYTCIEPRCLFAVSPTFTPTNCCEGIPTFHRAAC